MAPCNQDAGYKVSFSNQGLSQGVQVACLVTGRREECIMTKASLKQALESPSSLPNYTSVDEYVDRIMARNELRDWGFTNKHADELRRQLKGHDHADRLSPVGVRIWRGRDLAYNWAESLAWLQDEVKAQGLEYCQNFDSEPTFYPGSEIKGKPNLTAVGLDLMWDSKDGLVPSEVRYPRLYWQRRSLLSLEVPDLLCLNPQLMHIMDGKTFPFLMAAGFDLLVPGFYRNEDRLDVSCYWGGHRWRDSAVVCSRKL